MKPPSFITISNHNEAIESPFPPWEIHQFFIPIRIASSCRGDGDPAPAWAPPPAPGADAGAVVPWKSVSRGYPKMLGLQGKIPWKYGNSHETRENHPEHLEHPMNIPGKSHEHGWFMMENPQWLVFVREHPILMVDFMENPHLKISFCFGKSTVSKWIMIFGGAPMTSESSIWWLTGKIPKIHMELHHGISTWEFTLSHFFVTCYMVVFGSAWFFPPVFSWCFWLSCPIYNWSIRNTLPDIAG